jgi:hypothetical protein
MILGWIGIGMCVLALVSGILFLAIKQSYAYKRFIAAVTES